MAPAEPNAKPFQLLSEPPAFEEELEGWKGYIEWERYPEKKKRAAEILANYDFPVVSNIVCCTALKLMRCIASGVSNGATTQDESNTRRRALEVCSPSI